MNDHKVIDAQTFQYNSRGFARRLVCFSIQVRESIFKCFIEKTGITENDTVLDVGASAGETTESINFFENWYPYKDKITAVGLGNASYLERHYPGLKFLMADGKALPFKDHSFDFVISCAVIEHVGNRGEQERFIKECLRVAKKGVFIATPNRWYPVELHVLWLFIHWLPPKVFRKILWLLKKEPLHLEENLNLLSCGGLKELCRRLSVDRYSIIRHRLFGFTSNLVLYISKNEIG